MQITKQTITISITGKRYADMLAEKGDRINEGAGSQNKRAV